MGKKWGRAEVLAYFRANPGEWYGEAGHLKLLSGLKRYLPAAPDEAGQPIIGLDVGCCIGEYLVHFEGLLRSERAQILAFEPNPGNVRILRHEMERHPQCQLFQCCLSDVNARQVPFFFAGARTNPEGRNGEGSLRAAGARICNTDVYRLDGFLESRYGEDLWIQFAKIDTEGNDTNVIKGMGRYLQRTRCLIFECHHLLHGDQGPGIERPVQDIVEYLDARGFDTYRIGTRKIIPMNDRYWDPLYESVRYFTNCFVVKKDDPVIRALVDDKFDYLF